MNNPFNGDDKVLARLVREAGDPNVSPHPHYAEKLRATILDRVGPAETVAHGTEGIRKADVIPITVERIRPMKRIAKFAVAATIVVALGILVLWMTIGDGSTNIALANVAEALDSLRSVTYDCVREQKDAVNGQTNTSRAKGYFLAPSRERVESSMSFGSANEPVTSVMILDCLAAKGLTLLPEQKRAATISISVKEKSTGGTASMFDTVRRLIREGSTDSAENVESLGKKEIDGRMAVGFRRRTNMGDMTLWADPKTARLVRVETDMSGGGHSVLSNFCYDMELDSSLFSLEPPAGYTVENVDVAAPTEADLVNALRFVAEHNGGIFPATIGINSKECMEAGQAEAQAESAKLMATPEVQKRMVKVMAEHGKDKAAGMKEWMKEWMKMAEPITRKIMQNRVQGLMFYATLAPENDSHYAGKDVKLGTPDRPIFWYKPAGSDKYRVLYADLSVKEMTPDDVKKLPEAKAQ